MPALSIIFWLACCCLFPLQGNCHDLKVTLLSFDLIVTPAEVSLHSIIGVNPVKALLVAEQIDRYPKDRFFSDWEKQRWAKDRLKKIGVTVNGQSLDLQLADFKIPAFEPFLLARDENDTIVIKSVLPFPVGKGQEKDMEMIVSDDFLKGDARQFSHQVVGLGGMHVLAEAGKEKPMFKFVCTTADRPEASGANKTIKESQKISEKKPDPFGTQGFKKLLSGGLNSGPGVIAAFLLAALYGAVHALSPGHGKTLVAGYLVGSRGRVKDAVLLGIVVTLTHTGSVFLLGLAVIFLQEYIVPEDLFPFFSVASGILVLGLGGWLFWGRAMAFFKKRVSKETPDSHTHGHSHSHEHMHDKGHSHLDPAIARGIQEGVPALELIWLGVSGGIVPCPSALIVLLASIALGNLWFGMSLILSFSLGLALVLVVIGILLVKLVGFAGRFQRFAGVADYLPLMSALIIFLLGIYLTWQALIQGGLMRI